MMKYQRARRLASPSPATQSTTPLLRHSSHSAAQAQALGYSRLQGINTTVRRSASLSSHSLSRPSPPAEGSVPAHPSPPVTPPSAAEHLAQEARDLAQDKQQVELEFARYKAKPLVQPTGVKNMCDLLRHWEVEEFDLPLLFRVAMDVLPAQASAVPCERVFSSSKETCSLRRNRLGAELLEALQCLKYAYRQDRLSFVDGLFAKEEDYQICGPVTAAARQELEARGATGELSDLLRNVNEPASDWDSMPVVQSEV
ncbi:hypothetical protein HGRIS_006485 [Hohenbuehelia grisea]|uniref:HAT C-terminal dimerisation domain-containing protein n=1 Tax=Hohenbuehelia grisea TaxID=104357 RepID=A0ABR3K0I7_9AGAR